MVATGLRSTGTPADNALRSPLFAGVLERLRAGSRWSVLDLGKVQPTLVHLLQPSQGRLEVADLPAWLAAAGDLTAAEQDSLAIKAALPPPGDRPLDLCWSTEAEPPAGAKSPTCRAHRCLRLQCLPWRFSGAHSRRR
jgi:hypothetical protein